MYGEFQIYLLNEEQGLSANWTYLEYHAALLSILRPIDMPGLGFVDQQTSLMVNPPCISGILSKPTHKVHY